eukprot:CAMPEP_0175886306 /NCGR_PEP_ID=MMETSP0107_2-20121207/45559_1 /TAXON_ID=195067 ORGANISM="Goniomonas pacifica, Strain CCMP1869" /NCGR_SAMPLE_ID=MMETSP0107_2 /ASSEMBLY_ACC=CAM_ASM_000203 /LENGTH=78 /DNA_ID=CAMNT_0017206665 /DNA_START=1142 /DNA_END=1375 /DNA_ORIENTATION=-
MVHHKVLWSETQRRVTGNFVVLLSSLFGNLQMGDDVARATQPPGDDEKNAKRVDLDNHGARSGPRSHRVPLGPFSVRE